MPSSCQVGFGPGSLCKYFFDFQDLLLATGATVVDSLEALVKEEGLRGIVIQDDKTHDDETIGKWPIIFIMDGCNGRWMLEIFWSAFLETFWNAQRY